MIKNLKIVSENCKRGTTTVWDAEQVDKAIKILMRCLIFDMSIIILPPLH